MLQRIEKIQEVVRDNELVINQDYFKVMLSDDECMKVMEFIDTLVSMKAVPVKSVVAESKPICQTVDTNRVYQVRDVKNSYWTWETYMKKLDNKFNSLGIKCSWEVVAVEDCKTKQVMYELKHSGFFMPEKKIMEDYASVLTGVETINLQFVDKNGKLVDYTRHGFKSEIDAKNAIKYLPDRITEYMMQSYLQSGMTTVPPMALGTK